MKRRNFLLSGAIGTLGFGVGTNSCANEQSWANSKRVKNQLIKTDVLLVGGGPAGIGAARMGSKTLLIDSCGFFGGVASWSLGMPINQMRPGSNPRSVVYELLIEKLVALGDQAVHIGQH